MQATAAHGPLNCYSRGVLTARLGLALTTLNLFFVSGMVAFIYCWDRLDQFGPRGRWVVTNLLIQLHLGTENVVAAWYSSMLLLAVAVASAIAWRLERVRSDRARLAMGWLGLAAVFTVLSLDEIGSLHERLGMMVALNRASLIPASTTPVGWVLLFAIPIGIVAAFMLAFAWLHVRRVPAAFALIALGVALFVSNPLLEILEGRMLDAGSARGLILERILEEGVAELGGTSCFLLGVITYLVRTGGAGLRQMPWPSPRTTAIVGVLVTLAVPLAHAFGVRLPAGDSGTPEHWFPAAAFALLCFGLVVESGGRATAPVWIAAGLSAYFGAGIFANAGWYRAIGYRGALVDTIATAVATLLAVRLTRRVSP